MPPYTGYVRHCLRYYTRHSDTQPQSEVDKANWLACERALNEFGIGEREMLTAIYRGRDTVADIVFQLAKARNVEQDSIWKLIKTLEKKVAIYRGLRNVD